MASDSLPSNEKRSTAVHSLISHLDLLDLRVDFQNELTEGVDLQNQEEDGAENLGLIIDVDPQELNKVKLREFLSLDSDAFEKESNLEINRVKVIAPREASDRELQSYHSQNYIKSLLDDEINRRTGSLLSQSRFQDQEDGKPESERKRKRVKIGEGGTEDRRRFDEAFGLNDDNPRFPLLASHVRLVAGAALVAAEELIQERSDVVISWDGGRHHAKRGSASGFCYVNDIVLSILALCKPRLIKVNQEQRVDSSKSHDGQISPSTSISFGDTPRSSSLGFGSRPADILASAAAAAAAAPVGGLSDVPTPSASNRSVPPKSDSPPAKIQKPKSILKQSKVLYIDLDLHWGDGVEEAFFNSASVVTLSIHMFAPGFFPCGLSSRPNGASTISTSSPSESDSSSQDGDEETPLNSPSHPPGSLHGPCGPPEPNSAAHSALNLALRPGAGPETLSRVLKSCVEPFADVYQPDYIVIQAGCDALAGDPTATFNFSSNSILSAVSLILSWNKPTLIFGGGGYNTQNAAKCWAGVTALCLGRWELDQEDQEESSGREQSDGNLSSATQIPESDVNHWEIYSPDFNLDVKEGNMRDENDEEYLLEVERVFKSHIDRWKRRSNV